MRFRNVVLLVCAALASAAFAAETASHRRAAETNAWQPLLQQARAAWRTNSTTALALCDLAIAAGKTNAPAWFQRAAIHDYRREFDSARDDVVEGLRLDPRSSEGWEWRGMIEFKLRHFRDSVAAFDHLLELLPAQRPYQWQRGISLYCAGDYAEGRKQFELHQSVNPNDVENSVWHFLCVSRVDGVEQARKSMLKPGADPRPPMREILALFAGTGTADAVLSAAQGRRTQAEALFNAHLYLGLYFDAVGDKDRAREHLDKAAAMAPPHYMGEVAKVMKATIR